MKTNTIKRITVCALALAVFQMNAKAQGKVPPAQRLNISVVTGAAGTPASVSPFRQNKAWLYQFTIPAGPAGPAGAKGADGLPGARGPAGPPGTGGGGASSPVISELINSTDPTAGTPIFDFGNGVVLARFESVSGLQLINNAITTSRLVVVASVVTSGGGIASFPITIPKFNPAGLFTVINTDVQDLVSVRIIAGDPSTSGPVVTIDLLREAGPTATTNPNNTRWVGRAATQAAQP